MFGDLMDPRAASRAVARGRAPLLGPGRAEHEARRDLPEEGPTWGSRAGRVSAEVAAPGTPRHSAEAAQRRRLRLIGLPGRLSWAIFLLDLAVLRSR